MLMKGVFGPRVIISVKAKAGWVPPSGRVYACPSQCFHTSVPDGVASLRRTILVHFRRLPNVRLRATGCPVNPEGSSDTSRSTSGYPAVFSNLARVSLGFLGAWLVATLVFYRVTLTQTHSFLCNFDASVQSYAWHVANVNAVRHGALKLWDFSTSSGTSFIGEIQTAPLYPVTWL